MHFELYRLAENQSNYVFCNNKVDKYALQRGKKSCLKYIFLKTRETKKILKDKF